MPAVQQAAPAGGGGGVSQSVLDAATAEVISVLRAGAPAGEDTFDEVSDLLGTLTTAVAGKQPSDSDLAAIALLGTTTYGRAVLELADAASGRTYLGLGSAATASSASFDAAGAAAAAQAASQPVDSDLTAVAALSTTSYGRGVLALADASALRSTAGLVLGTDIYSKSATDAAFAPLSPFARASRTAGDITINSTSFTNLDTGLDLTLAGVSAGQVVVVDVSGLWGNENVSGLLDVATIVAGSPVNYFSSGTGTPVTDGMQGWAKENGGNGTYQTIAGAAVLVLQAGDISGGSVTLRLRVKTGSATNLKILANTNNKFFWWARAFRPLA